MRVFNSFDAMFNAQFRGGLRVRNKGGKLSDFCGDGKIAYLKPYKNGFLVNLHENVYYDFVKFADKGFMDEMDDSFQQDLEYATRFPVYFEKGEDTESIYQQLEFCKHLYNTVKSYLN